MTKEEALQQKTLLEEMEELLQEYQELTEEMLLELEQAGQLFAPDIYENYVFSNLSPSLPSILRYSFFLRNNMF